MKPSLKRLISSVSAALLLVVAIVVFFNFIVPVYRDIKATRAEAASRSQALENQKRVVQEVRALVASYTEGARIQEIVSSALPLAPDTGDAILELGGIAQANNLVPRSFTVAGGAEAAAKSDIRKNAGIVKPVASMTIRMEATGGYEDFRNFMKNLETNIRVFDVREMTVRPVLKSTQNLFSYNLTVVAYYQP